jgi:hypothetical protein
MSQIIPIYIPTFISDQNFNPSRVLPHIYFYNGLIDCEEWWIESGSLTTAGVSYAQTSFPYFDNYNVVTGSFPTTNSDSLLFNNEAAVYGEIPTGSLYTNYWETYISLLYNPKTRLLNCEAIIPLADYIKMELNDVVNFRGNYYHLRAINDYSLKDGSCNLQLLGPIIADTLSDLQPIPTPPTGSTAYATASIHLEEYNASPAAFIDANLIVSGTAYYFSGDFTQSISGGTIANVVMEGKDGGSTVWGGYTTASATLTTLDNGTLITSSTQYIYSGSGDTVITFPTTFTAGHNITISGSTAVIPTGSCCTPTITSASVSGGDISIFFTTGSGCSGCTATTIERSSDGSTWGVSNTGGCNSPRVITAPTASTYYRMYENCSSLTSSFSNSYYFASGSGGTADLDWTFTITGGPSATMDIYINGVNVESRNATSSGTETGLVVGDEIYFVMDATGCSGFNDTANVYSFGIISDTGNCPNSGTTSLTSTTYTIASGDIGTTLTLDLYANCDSGCV